MTHPLTILTGATRGMGRAMASQLLRAGGVLLCISRGTDDTLAEEAQRAGAVLHQWPHDLSQPQALTPRLRQWLAAQPAASFSHATLINNAALLPPIAPLRDAEDDAVVPALRVGLEAPMLLTAAFLAATRGWAAQRRVLNISSGLGRRAMASQSGYCAVKAGMDHFTRCLALEEATQPNGARVCSLAPGVIDTAMQVQLRGTDAARFPDVGNFIGLKDKGLLASPEAAARQVLAWLERPDFGANPVADVRD